VTEAELAAAAAEVAAAEADLVAGREAAEAADRALKPPKRDPN